MEREDIQANRVESGDLPQDGIHTGLASKLTTLTEAEWREFIDLASQLLNPPAY